MLVARQPKPRVAILHFAGPPGVGGVEWVMHHQATVLARLGYGVRIIAGSGAITDGRVEVMTDARLSSTHPEVLAVKAELDSGVISTRFDALRADISYVLETALADRDICIAHNIAGLHKNLALTAALRMIAQKASFKLIHWYHDLAWTNRQYRAELHHGYPWDLLRNAWSSARHVTISDARGRELTELLRIPTDDIHVIPGGIDPPQFLRLTPRITQLDEHLRMTAADAILLYPTRLTRRKNIELALDILAALRAQTKCDIRLLVTGPPGSHNPANARYLDALVEQRERLHLTTSAHLLYCEGDDPATPLLLDDDDIASLYSLADALLFTSLQEGFGIPILEAGLAGIPIFCSDLPPLRETAGDAAGYFDPVSDTPGQIAHRLWAALDGSPRYRLRKRVRQHFTWDAIITRDLIPLLEGTL